MLLLTLNKSKQLMHIGYFGHVRLEEFQRNREDFTTQLAQLSSGFRLLADFTQLERMDVECAAELGRMMELAGQAGVSLVVRVIPDSSKDIGMNILTAFHYAHRPRVVTCRNMTEAASALEL